MPHLTEQKGTRFYVDPDLMASWSPEFQQIARDAAEMAEYQMAAELPMIPVHYTLWFTDGRLSMCGLDFKANPALERLNFQGPNHKACTFLPAGREYCHGNAAPDTRPI